MLFCVHRCFFIHLGIAMGIHPFALQCGFRRLASAVLLTAGTCVTYFGIVLCALCLQQLL